MNSDPFIILSPSLIILFIKDIFVINVDDPAEEYPDLNSVWQRFQSVMVTTGSAASHVAAFTDYMTRAFEVRMNEQMNE